MRAALVLFGVMLWTPAACAADARIARDEPKVPPASVPVLRSSGRSTADFVPRGWQVVSLAKGDLNGDGRPDLAFLLHGTDKALMLANDIAPDDPLDSNPYVLGVAFANADGTYSLVLQNHTLIARWTEATLDEYSQTVTVKNGSLSVWIHSFRSDGNTDQTFLFRYGQGRFKLIGHEREELNRADQTGVRYSLNYLTRQETITDFDNEKGSEKVQHKRLPAQPAMSIEQVGSADDFYHFMD